MSVYIPKYITNNTDHKPHLSFRCANTSTSYSHRLGRLWYFKPNAWKVRMMASSEDQSTKSRVYCGGARVQTLRDHASRYLDWIGDPSPTNQLEKLERLRCTRSHWSICAICLLGVGIGEPGLLQQDWMSKYLRGVQCNVLFAQDSDELDGVDRRAAQTDKVRIVSDVGDVDAQYL